MSRNRNGGPVPMKFTGKDGVKYDFNKNTMDGALPLAVGDIFFYRGKGSPSATVTKVRVADIQGRLALLDQMSGTDDAGVYAQMWVDLSRVEVVQMHKAAQPLTV